MTVAIIILVVLIVVVGTIFTLRTSARSGMPSKAVLERAKQRTRELDATEKTEPGESRD
jgi:hypothetical protein